MIQGQDPAANLSNPPNNDTSKCMREVLAEIAVPPLEMPRVTSKDTTLFDFLSQRVSSADFVPLIPQSDFEGDAIQPVPGTSFSHRFNSNDSFLGFINEMASQPGLVSGTKTSQRVSSADFFDASRKGADDDGQKPPDDAAKEHRTTLTDPDRLGATSDAYRFNSNDSFFELAKDVGSQRVTSSDFFDALLNDNHAQHPPEADPKDHGTTLSDMLSTTNTNTQHPPDAAPKDHGTIVSLTTSPTSSTVPPPLLCSDISEPGENDVICGRGGGANHHIGNRKYRQMAVDLKKQVMAEFKVNDYEKLEKTDKTKVSHRLVKMVHAEGGRFLEPNANAWHELTLGKARRKCSQVLREKKQCKLKP